MAVRWPASAASTGRRCVPGCRGPASPGRPGRPRPCRRRGASRRRGAGDHRAEALHREDPVDRQAGDAPGGRGSTSGAHALQGGPQLGDAAAGLVETGMIGAPSRNVPRTKPRPPGRPSPASRLDQVGLGEHDQAAADAEQAADVEVLARLGHDPLVGGDDQQDQVDPGRAGDHVVDELLVAGDVDDADRVRPGQARWAKPSSMVIPRSFSSLRRSVLMPVRALTSVVLPWSMCPAVPTMRWLTRSDPARASATSGSSSTATVRRSSRRRPSSIRPITGSGAGARRSSSRWRRGGSMRRRGPRRGGPAGGAIRRPPARRSSDERRPEVRPGGGGAAGAGRPGRRRSGLRVEADHAQRRGREQGGAVVQVEAQGRLQGGGGELVDAHRPVQGIGGDGRDQVAAADDDARPAGRRGACRR